jgi:cell division septum initiation protein DivIVA
LSEKEGEYSELLQSIEDEYKTIVSSKDSEIEALKKDLEEEKSKEDKYEAMVTVLEEEIQETKQKTEKETKENILKTLETL